MAEVTETVAKKAKTEVQMVKMTDGREVGFAGKRKLVKDILIDSAQTVSDGDTITLASGAVSVRLDFRNGETIKFPVPVSIIAQAIGHGISQKLGDETAGTVEVDDMVLDVQELCDRLSKGEWSVTREAGDGFAGASLVVKAICEVSGKSVDFVKAFLQKKLDDAKAQGEKLSRQDLYSSFKAPGTKTAEVIKRLEAEKLTKTAKVDANAALDEMAA